VHVSSKKQQLITKPSTEAELVGLSNRVPQTIWVRDFMQSQGYELGPAKVLQGIQSTVALVVKGRSTSARTTHVAIRFFFTKDRVDSGELEIVYLPKGEMRAEILTIPQDAARSQGTTVKPPRLPGVRRNSGCPNF
jgi:hypothetical protein